MSPAPATARGSTTSPSRQARQADDPARPAESGGDIPGYQVPFGSREMPLPYRLGHRRQIR